MADLTVKQKLGFFQNIGARVADHSSRILGIAALLTFIGSLAGVFPDQAVERWFARWIFPGLSLIVGNVSDLVPFAWLDFVVLGTLALLFVAWKKKRVGWVISAVASAYLFFFWTWGLNYHRTPLVSKLPFDSKKAAAANIELFARRTAQKLNALYVAKERAAFNEARIREVARQRVTRVIHVIDGRSWDAAGRIKTSVVANPWFRVAGIDGVFNPFGHEPIVSATLLDIEQPFVIAHELAHVRGYPTEGDANMIALLATVMSDDAAIQYSGWLHLWLYLRSRDLDALLDEGPRKDQLRIFERARAERIRWLSTLQTAILDLFLKANSVEQGVRSYSEIVVLAAGTEENWERFR